MCNLTSDELAALNALTEPTFGFPQNLLTTTASMMNGGTTVNGISAPISEYVMPQGNQPY